MRRLFRFSIIRISNNKVDPPGVVVGNVVQTSLGKENENNVSEMNSV